MCAHVRLGNTVSLQYSSGTHRISSWSDLTNAHSLPGPGIITGLASVGLPLSRGLLLLAEMSCSNNLLNEQYTEATLQMARKNRDFVVGFIAMHRIPEVGSRKGEDEEDWLILTPGVGMAEKGDGMGQQYRTPKEVIGEKGCDVIIVGRGIYKVKGKEREEAERYRAEGWRAYEERLAKA